MRTHILDAGWGCPVPTLSLNNTIHRHEESRNGVSQRVEAQIASAYPRDGITPQQRQAGSAG